MSFLGRQGRFVWFYQERSHNNERDHRFERVKLLSGGGRPVRLRFWSSIKRLHHWEHLTCERADKIHQRLNDSPVRPLQIFRKLHAGRSKQGDERRVHLQLIVVAHIFR